MTDHHDLTAAYALDALDEEERTAYEAHLDECPECIEELAEFAPVVEALASGVESPAPAGLRVSVMDAIASTPQLPAMHDTMAGAVMTSPATTAASTPDNVISLASRRRSWFPAVAVAAAVAIIAGLALTFLSGDELTPTEELAAEADAVITSIDEGSVTLDIIWSPELDEVAVTGSGLTDPTDSETFQLWFVLADGTVARAGLFGSSQGEADKRWATENLDAVAWGVTVEPAGGSAQPTSEIIFFEEITSA